MSRLGLYFLVVGVVFAVNLLPAFGPPTWAVLVYFRFHDQLAVVPLVLLGAVAAASGRVLLALAFRMLRDKVSAKQRANLQAAGQLLQKDRKRSLAGIALFALSPVPSAQLFEAAGLIEAPLRTLTLAFFAGRLISYSAYLTGAVAAQHTDLGRLIADSLTSPLGIAVQVLLLAAVFALTRIDWQARLQH
jgi:hypothetical protein